MTEEGTAPTNRFEPGPYLNALIAAVNDGAKAAQGGALLFLLVGLYLLATAFGVSDEDLLLGRTVTILQIGATLPVGFSFAIAPMVFVFLHGYALVRYDMLAANIRQFRREVQETVKEENDRERCRQLLANVEFVDALTTPRSSADYTRLWRWLFLGIVVVFPVAVLLLVQINSLRYQSDVITNVQRVWLALDLAVLVWFFVRRPLDTAGEGSSVQPWRRFGLPVALVFGLNILWVRTPGNRLSPILESVSLANLVLQPLDVACAEWKWGCRYLRVDHRTLVDKVWDDKAMANLRTGGAEAASALAGVEGVYLRGRSLRYAVLDRSRLYAADLIGTDLTGASLNSTDLTGAKMYTADLRAADLDGANLSRADLDNAFLVDGAILTFANLSDASLRNAYLSEAHLYAANLRGATLNAANLVNADLTGVNLSGADLSLAYLGGANLYRADLTGAILDDANFMRPFPVRNLTQSQLDQACGTNAELPPGLILKRPCPSTERNAPATSR